MQRRSRRAALAMAVATVFTACASDDEAPARMPDRLQVAAPARVEVGEAFRPVPSAAADDGLRYDWDFGDGQRSQQPLPTHAYGQPGRHELSLTLSNSSGEKWTAQASVQAGYFAPLAGRTCSAGPETGWCWQMPLPFASHVRDPVFADAEHGWAGGEAGYLFITSDGGRHWERQMTPMTEGITHLRLASASTGWAFNARSRRLMRSDDGGRQWSMVGRADNYQLSLWAVSLSGPMVMSAIDFSEPQSAASDDGGATWRKLGQPVSLVGPDGVLWADETQRLGWPPEDSGRGILWTSTDGGRSFGVAHDGRTGGRRLDGSLVASTSGVSFLVEAAESQRPAQFVRNHRTNPRDAWQTLPSDLRLSDAGRLREPVQMFPDGRGWAIVDVYTDLDDAPPVSHLMHTTDAGLHWTERALPPQMRFAELDRQGGIDGRSYLLRPTQPGDPAWLTVDGGASWQRAGASQEGWAVPYSLRRSAGGHLVAGYGHSADERMYVSSDDGATWSPLFATPLPDESSSVVGLWFFNPQQGLALRNNSLLATDDGGRSWRPQPVAELGATGASHSLHFTADGSGWAVMGGVLHRSDDRGIQWQRVATPSDAGNLSRAQFVDARNGWLLTRLCPVVSRTCQDLLHATRDGGAHWTRLNGPPALREGMSVYLVSPEIGLAIVDQRLWRSTDGGQSWLATPVQRGGWSTHLYFRTPVEGWLLDTNLLVGAGEALRTRDGGLTWRKIELPTGIGTLSGIHFADARHGLMIDQQGQVLRTEDGGDTWTLQSTGSETYLETVFMLDAETAWIGGSRSTILSTATGGR